MANARALRKRIKSVGSTKKITRTMELVATAKSKRAQTRVLAARPYVQGLSELLTAVRMGLAAGLSDPLLCEVASGPEALLVVTANRGLCGGFNSNVLRLAQAQPRASDVEMHVIGKKGVAYFTYAKRAIASRITDLSDTPTYAEADRIVTPFLERFLRGELRRVRVVSTLYLTATRQEPRVHTLLPVTPPVTPPVTEGRPAQAAGASSAIGPLWDPSPEALLGTLLPQYVRADFLRILMEHSVSEQTARRVAMKNATDNAQEMSKMLTRTYNRARQGQITQQ
ncbi:MAG: ATP synthase F1 subunit gamma, partial [Planctomycetes bacterium]|nr:ATP synthase F1 subunit gamma [Planctomycetota bacterium]